MQPRKLSVKFFANNADGLDLSGLVPIYQKWIQQKTVPGMLIDAADYKHVHEGPGVMLIADEGDYAFDLKDGRPGLVYFRKRHLADTLRDNLNLTLHHVLAAVTAIQKESLFESIDFDLSGLEIQFIDRLNTPNTPESFESLREAVVDFAESIFGEGAEISVNAAHEDPREALSIIVKSSAALDPTRLIEHLNPTP